jgi:hypothetical protein
MRLSVLMISALAISPIHYAAAQAGNVTLAIGSVNGVPTPQIGVVGPTGFLSNFLGTPMSATPMSATPMSASVRPLTALSSPSSSSSASSSSSFSSSGYPAVP